MSYFNKFTRRIILICLFIIFNLVPLNAQSSIFPPKIYTYEENENLPLLMRINLQRLTLQAKIIGYQVIFITNKNISSFINMNQINQLNKIIVNNNKQVKKDLIKLTLLQKYAGLYVDLGIVLTQSLNWFVDLANNKQLVNRNLNIKKFPSIFMFYNPMKMHADEYSHGDNELANQFPGYDYNFIGIRDVNSQLIREWRYEFIKLYGKNQDQYKRGRYESNILQVNVKDTDNQYRIDYSFYKLILQKQQTINKQFSLKLINNMKRKNIHEQLGIWTIDCQYGPCMIENGLYRKKYNLFQFGEIDVNQLLTRLTQKQFLSKYNTNKHKKQIQYYFKLPQRQLQHFSWMISDQIMWAKRNLTILEKYIHMKEQYSDFQCDKQILILKGSLLDKYFVQHKNSFVNVKQMPKIASLYERTQFQEHCDYQYYTENRNYCFIFLFGALCFCYILRELFVSGQVTKNILQKQVQAQLKFRSFNQRVYCFLVILSRCMFSVFIVYYSFYLDYQHYYRRLYSLLIIFFVKWGMETVQKRFKFSKNINKFIKNINKMFNQPMQIYGLCKLVLILLDMQTHNMILAQLMLSFIGFHVIRSAQDISREIIFSSEYFSSCSSVVYRISRVFSILQGNYQKIIIFTLMFYSVFSDLRYKLFFHDHKYSILPVYLAIGYVLFAAGYVLVCGVLGCRNKSMINNNRMTKSNRKQSGSDIIIEQKDQDTNIYNIDERKQQNHKNNNNQHQHQDQDQHIQIQLSRLRLRLNNSSYGTQIFLFIYIIFTLKVQFNYLALHYVQQQFRLLLQLNLLFVIMLYGYGKVYFTCVNEEIGQDILLSYKYNNEVINSNINNMKNRQIGIKYRVFNFGILLLFLGLFLIVKWQYQDKNRPPKGNWVVLFENFMWVVMLINGVGVVYSIIIDNLRIMWKFIQNIRINM